MSKQLIGYRLLQDLPTIAKGSIFTLSEDKFVYTGGVTDLYEFIKEDTTQYPKFPIDYIKENNKWFEAVYEEEYEIGEWVIAKITTEYIGKYKGTRKSGYYDLTDWDILKSLDNIEYEPSNGGVFESIVRRATPEEIKKVTEPNFKKGDIVFVIKDFKNNTTLEDILDGTVGIITNVKNSNQNWEDMGARGTNNEYNYIVKVPNKSDRVVWSVRKATPNEIEKYKNESIFQDLIIGNNSITIRVKKDSIEIVEKGRKINYNTLKLFYNQFITGVHISIGGYEVNVADHAYRTFRIGCKDENNLVSLNEISSVLKTYEKLNTTKI